MMAAGRRVRFVSCSTVECCLRTADCSSSSRLCVVAACAVAASDSAMSLPAAGRLGSDGAQQAQLGRKLEGVARTTCVRSAEHPDPAQTVAFRNPPHRPPPTGTLGSRASRTRSSSAAGLCCRRGGRAAGRARAAAPDAHPPRIPRPSSRWGAHGHSLDTLFSLCSLCSAVALRQPSRSKLCAFCCSMDCAPKLCASCVRVGANRTRDHLGQVRGDGMGRQRGGRLLLRAAAREESGVGR